MCIYIYIYTFILSLCIPENSHASIVITVYVRTYIYCQQRVPQALQVRTLPAESVLDRACATQSCESMNGLYCGSCRRHWEGESSTSTEAFAAFVVALCGNLDIMKIPVRIVHLRVFRGLA